MREKIDNLPEDALYQKGCIYESPDDGKTIYRTFIEDVNKRTEESYENVISSLKQQIAHLEATINDMKRKIN